MVNLASDIHFQLSPIFTSDSGHDVQLELKCSHFVSRNEAVIDQGQSHDKAFVDPFEVKAWICIRSGTAQLSNDLPKVQPKAICSLFL
jgi:hypothetical protein